MRAGVDGLRDLLDDLEISRVYETAPRYVTEQPEFLNACCVGRTRMTVCQVLEGLKHIERLAGRRSGGVRYGPRPLDLDLLLFDEAVVEKPDLIVPHPRLHERSFVLVPLAEIAPNWLVPAHAGQPATTVASLARASDLVGITRTDVDLS